MAPSRKATKKDTTFAYVVGSIGVIILVILIFLSLPGTNQQISNTSSFVPYYSLESTGTNCEYQDRRCDLKLVLYESSYNKRIIEPNLTQLYAEQLQDKAVIELKIHYQSFEPSKIVIATQYTDGQGFLWFEPESASFRKLKNIAYAGGFPSPDHRWMVNPAGNVISISDVLTDQTKILIQLTEPNETLDNVYDWKIGGPGATDVEWLNDRTIKYGVYDERDPLRGEGPYAIELPREPIDTRTVTIPD